MASRSGRARSSFGVADDMDAVFVFDSGPGPLVTVYQSLESVSGLLESLDVDDNGSQPAFTTEGRLAVTLDGVVGS